jgi:hypothetical protein
MEMSSTQFTVMLALMLAPAYTLLSVVVGGWLFYRARSGRSPLPDFRAEKPEAAPEIKRPQSKPRV